MKKRELVLAIAIGITLSACNQAGGDGIKSIQDYMPDNAVIAHRGTIYWAPELTEAAFRWARNTGSDYMELDVHRSKDGVLIIIHDRTFRRTTNVAEIFPGRENDPIDSFTYEEIAILDAGSPFNRLRPEQARESFTGQDVPVFEDIFRIAEGKRIKRNPDGSRIFHVDKNGKYRFEYEPDPDDNGHRPGIYIEVKANENYPGIEEQIYEELTAIDWNPLEGNVIRKNTPFHAGEKVNIGNTRGKILIQTFSRPGMANFKRVFGEKVLCSFLISNNRNTDFTSEEVLDELISFALENGAQFIGTNLGEENDGLPPTLRKRFGQPVSRPMYIHLTPWIRWKNTLVKEPEKALALWPTE
jgi:glycerophosphoryl diester phosphodiesterase